MKTILCCLVASIFALTAFAQTSTGVTGATGTASSITATNAGYPVAPPSNEPVHNYQGEYILITRSWDNSWGGCFTLTSSGTTQWSEGQSCGSASWKYDMRPYASLADAKMELTAECSMYSGSHYPCMYPSNSSDHRNYSKEFVGIFRLERVLGADDVKFSEGDTVKTHTVEEKEHWFQWTVKDQQAKK